MSFSITLRKTADGIEVTGSTALESIPDGELQVMGHVNDGPGSANDSLGVRDARGMYASATAPTPASPAQA